jgi:hypothetical protein
VTMRFLLDTNVLSDLVRHPHSQIAHRIKTSRGTAGSYKHHRGSRIALWCGKERFIAAKKSNSNHDPPSADTTIRDRQAGRWARGLLRAVGRDTFYMMAAYPKSERDDLSAEQRRRILAALESIKKPRS